MPKIVYVDSGGEERVVDASAGESVMSAAVRAGVPGIIGECGGCLSCGTCHVRVREEYVDQVGEVGDMEDDLLDLAVGDRQVNSRLSCQIQMTSELDGLIVDVPDEQVV
ncbi:2Fe-2S iron-sulfur cluster-binding protein [Amycolatopsis sp. NPDC023774]|uniref:2Fe-2S iron-sulfur cluster-binding protein n=1 Tax=Amycolatopsis carbonis TaxID=715471 RepID=A0A9Y2MUR5_9PSEU|nr:2Fe-2S iron-sulfur cluster-binding protein [Amycolatopsis sp. 2-15]WIX79211.1 2Fe-2S iron-sulfur cluster-binding protein [Amycolatopsis sp. 2-15]